MNAFTPLTPPEPAPLPHAIVAAIKRAAKRIEDASHDAEYDAPTVSAEVAAETITEELRPALLGGPLSPFDASVEREAPPMIIGGTRLCDRCGQVHRPFGECP